MFWCKTANWLPLLQYVTCMLIFSDCSGAFFRKYKQVFPRSWNANRWVWSFSLDHLHCQSYKHSASCFMVTLYLFYKATDSGTHAPSPSPPKNEKNQPHPPKITSNLYISVKSIFWMTMFWYCGVRMSCAYLHIWFMQIHANSLTHANTYT